jgi:hypothetical protein
VNCIKQAIKLRTGDQHVSAATIVEVAKEFETFVRGKNTPSEATPEPFVPTAQADNRKARNRY